MADETHPSLHDDYISTRYLRKTPYLHVSARFGRKISDRSDSFVTAARRCYAVSMESSARPPHPPPILETALYADDLDAAETFYAGLMGLNVAMKKPGRHVFFRVPGGMLMLFRPAATRVSGDPDRPGHLTHGAEGPGHVCFAAEAPDLEVWRRHFLAQGIEIEDDFRWPNGARSIYVRDPAGNSVEFAEPRLWAG